MEIPLERDFIESWPTNCIKQPNAMLQIDASKPPRYTCRVNWTPRASLLENKSIKKCMINHMKQDLNLGVRNWTVYLSAIQALSILSDSLIWIHVKIWQRKSTGQDVDWVIGTWEIAAPGGLGALNVDLDGPRGRLTLNPDCEEKPGPGPRVARRPSIIQRIFFLEASGNPTLWHGAYVSRRTIWHMVM